MSVIGETQTGFSRFLRNETGATAIEYGLIAMLVSIGLIGALWVYSDAVTSVYEADAAAIDSVVAQQP